MTIELERPVAVPVVVEQPVPVPVEEEQAPSLSAMRVAVTAALATSGAAVVAGGMFAGTLARVVAVLAAVCSALVVGLALRRGSTVLQYLVAPGIFVSGYLVALVLPNPTGVTGTVPELVRRALRNGGLAHPPIPFDPGWRFLLCAMLGLVAAGAVSLASSYRNPRLAVLVPVPVLAGAALNQPHGHELVGSLIGLGFVLVALSVSFSAELAGSGEVGRGFELRQLARALVATAACLAALGGLSQASFLFPAPAASQQARPEKPQVVPLSHIKDRPLFDVSTTGAPSQGPWRVGVLDSYNQNAWYLPGFDPSRYVDVTETPGGPVRSTVTVRDLDGFTLPTYVGSGRATATAALQLDPRTGTFRTKDGAPHAGMTYTLEAAKPPNGDEIAAAAGKPQPAELKSYLTVPAAPLEVDRLLARANQNPWERLQVLRARLYAQVIAAGSGVPSDVPPAKVVAMLSGAKATPYEIVAGEALLARWAGLPSRIGYGYYGGSQVGTDLQFRPRDGANWLEVYLPGRGWVAVIGTPRRAQGSLDGSTHNNRPQVLPSNQVTLQVYVPVLNHDPQLLFEQVRYYVSRLVPLVLGLFVLWRAVPLLARRVRGRRRLRWALAHGPAGRIAVAYAELRDTARDLGLDDGTTTPLQYLDQVEQDVEHTELAWLTTRALWGDLASDLREEDAVAAEAMSRSLRSRLRRGQGGLVQLAAATSRASLRTPYDVGLPNAWPHRPSWRPPRRAGLARIAWSRP